MVHIDPGKLPRILRSLGTGVGRSPRKASGRLAALAAVVVLMGCARGSPDSAPTSSPPLQTMSREADGMEMALVPGATFRLSEQGKGGKGAHEVSLDAYWIDGTEVTNAQYRLCVEAGGCRPASTCAWGEPTYDDPAFEEHPVICVSWRMAADYCSWAGGRLPTEAEWDYAARGPERWVYAWGDTFDPARLNFCDASCANADKRYEDEDDGYAQTAPVGSYPEGASWCGTLDMNGNVWEWVADWHAPYSRGSQVNPTGPRGGSERVMRGGSWYDSPDFLKADHRHPFDPQDTNHLIGFRCAMPGAASAP